MSLLVESTLLALLVDLWYDILLTRDIGVEFCLLGLKGKAHLLWGLYYRLVSYLIDACRQA